jgi:putative transposase
MRGDKAHRCRTIAVTVYREAFTFVFTINPLERRAYLVVRHIEPVAGGSEVYASRATILYRRLGRASRIPCTVIALPGDDAFSDGIKAIKSRFVQALAPTEGRSSVRIAKGECGI